MDTESALDSSMKSAAAAISQAGGELSEIGNRARSFAEARPYVAVLSALAAGYLLARVAARIR